VSTTRVKANTRADFEAEIRTGSPFGAANFSSDKGWLELAGNGRQFAGARIVKSEDPEVLRVKRKGRGSLLCRRVEFDAGTAGVSQSEQLVCFLPWLLSYGNCRKARLLPPNLLAAYEMPHGIVSSSPETCVAALQVVVDDFLELMLERSLQPAKLTLLGLSIGNFAATYIANMIGARLWAVAPGDRGEVLLWNSSIARGLRSQAEARGFGYADFEATLKAFNPVNNLRHIGAGSTFIVGRFDTVVPYRSAMNVATEAKANNPTARNLVLPLGHSSTLFTGVQLLRFNLWNRKCRAA
jgi:hypothetical protein